MSGGGRGCECQEGLALAIERGWWECFSNYGQIYEFEMILRNEASRRDIHVGVRWHWLRMPGGVRAGYRERPAGVLLQLRSDLRIRNDPQERG